MDINLIKRYYFYWIYNKVCPQKTYYKLLQILFETPFIYSIPTDGNRYEDGINLRYKFGDENNISSIDICKSIDYNECSVLEMMAALAIRCEESITEENYTAKMLFNDMLKSLGLKNMNDSNINENKVRKIIDDFLNHNYLPNGTGGLFTVNGYEGDLSTVEIWYQMHWHLNEII